MHPLLSSFPKFLYSSAGFLLLLRSEGGAFENLYQLLHDILDFGIYDVPYYLKITIDLLVLLVRYCILGPYHSFQATITNMSLTDEQLEKVCQIYAINWN